VDWPIGDVKGQQTMEFAPIAGIRAESLLNIQKAADKVAPRFEIEASERSGDEKYSPSQQPPERGLEEEEASEESEGEVEAESGENTPAGNFDWFV
jgi:hypothetical protein